MKTQNQGGSERAWLAEPIALMHAAKPASGNQDCGRSGHAPYRLWLRQCAIAASVAAGRPKTRGEQAARIGLYRPAPSSVAG